MATTSYSFTDIVDFTRATAATYVNSSGLVTVTPTSKNILTYSQSFTNWTALRTTVTPNITTAPNGQMLASKLTDNSEATAHVITLSPTSPVSGGVYTFSAYVKKNTHPYVYLSLYNTTNAYVSAVFNLDTGAVTQTSVGSSVNVALVTTNITNEGSGWFRISITGVITSGTIANVYIGFAPYSTGNTYGGSGQISYSGNGTNSFYVWGAQLEPTSYNNLTLGAERVVGGNFESGLIGTKTDGGTPTSVSTYTLNTVSPISGTQDGKVTITTATTGSWPRITGIPSATKTIGTVYLLSFDYVVLSGAMVIDAVYNGSTTSSNVAGTNYTGSGKFQMLYTARGTTASEGIYFGNSLCSVQIDNFSVKQVTGLTGYPTSYTKNFGSVYPPRFDYDPITLQPKGFLIEEQRSNLITYSEDFSLWSNTSITVTPNSTVSPDGQTSADTLTASSSSGYVYRPITFTTDADKSVSIFLKAGTSASNYIVLRDSTASVNRAAVTVTWSGGVPSAVASTGTVQGVQNYGNGWYRISILAVGVIAANGNQIRILPDNIVGTGTVIIWGAQAENGAFATSYIPTVTSTVTRNADVANVSGVNFSTWNNPARGTILIDMDLIGVPTGNFQAFTLGVAGDAIFFRVSSTAITDIVYFSGPSVASLSVLATAPVTNTRYKNALAYSTNDFAGVLNNGTVLTDNSGNVPIATSCSIGNNGAGISVFNGHIRLMRYYPTRLTNAQIQALTV